MNVVPSLFQMQKSVIWTFPYTMVTEATVAAMHFSLFFPSASFTVAVQIWLSQPLFSGRPV